MSIRRIKEIDALRIRAYTTLIGRHGGHPLSYGRIETPGLPGFSIITQECRACGTLLGFFALPAQTCDAIESSMRLPPSSSVLPAAGRGVPPVVRPTCQFGCVLCIDNQSCRSCTLCKSRILLSGRPG